MAKVFKHLLVGLAEALVSVEHPDLGEMFLALLQQHEHGHDDSAFAHTGRHDQQEARAPLRQSGDSDRGQRVLARVRSVLELFHFELDLLPFLLEGPNLWLGHEEFRLACAVVARDGHLGQSLLHGLNFCKLDPVLGLGHSLGSFSHGLLLLER